MADSPKKPKAKRRVVRNPETFRERALKASEAGDRPGRVKRSRSVISRGLAKVFRPVGKLFSRLFRFKPFKIIGKIFRFIGLIIFPRYFRNSWKELRQVTWPSRKQARQLTFAVLGFAIVFGAAIAGVDYGLDKLFRHILLK